MHSSLLCSKFLSYRAQGNVCNSAVRVFAVAFRHKPEDKIFQSQKLTAKNQCSAVIVYLAVNSFKNEYFFLTDQVE